MIMMIIIFINYVVFGMHPRVIVDDSIRVAGCIQHTLIQTTATLMLLFINDMHGCIPWAAGVDQCKRDLPMFCIQDCPVPQYLSWIHTGQSWIQNIMGKFCMH